MPSSHLPTSLALIAVAPSSGAEPESGAILAESTVRFASGDELLASAQAYEHNVYVVGEQLPLSEGIPLVRLLRLRVTVGIIAWHTRAPCSRWLDAGADMWLPRGTSDTDLAAAIRAVRRRAGMDSPPAATPAWLLDRARSCLFAPNGIEVQLSASDVDLLECFAAAAGSPVPHGQLCEKLAHPCMDADNWLHATVYRLRRRIERATADVLPLASRAGVGYVFSEPLSMR